MASSSEQDNLDFLLEEETDTNNCSNTEDGVQKDVPLAPLPALQPVTPSNLTNLNLTQLLALLQNSIQIQSNIDPSVATLPALPKIRLLWTPQVKILKKMRTMMMKKMNYCRI